MNKTIFVITCMMLLFMGLVSANTYYVNITHPSCSDTYNRSTSQDPATPICSFKRGIANLSSGDLMYVAGGEYNESNESDEYNDSGAYTLTNKQFTNLTVITAYPGDSPELNDRIGQFYTTGGSGWKNQSATVAGLWNQTYVTSSTYLSVMRIATNGTMFIYTSLADVENTSLPEGCYYNTAAGTDALWCRFDNTSFNPNNEYWYVTRSPIFTLKNVSNLMIANLSFRGGYKSLYVSAGQTNNNLTITGNTFTGAFGTGIIDIRNCTNTTISHNYIEQIRSDTWDWTTAKSSLMEDSAIRFEDCREGVNASNNKIFTIFNGIGLQYQDPSQFSHAIISYNNISNILDDGIEPDGSYSGIYIGHNNINDSFVGISVSPLNCSGQDTCIIEYNVIVSNKSILKTLPSDYETGECYKLLPGGGNMGLRNVNISHNTCIGRGLYSSLSNNMSDATWTDNIFYGNTYSTYHSGLALNGVFYDYNIYFNFLSGNLFKYWNNDTSATAFTTLADAKASSQWDGNWDVNSLQADPLFLDYVSFQPNSTSPVCGAASDGGDIGAVPCAAASDTTSPVVNLLNVSFNTTSTTPSISFNTTDSSSTIMNCTLYFNATNKSQNTTVQNNTLTTLTSSSLTSLGTYNAYVNCTDLSGNIGKSSTINITLQDAVAPSVTLLNASFNFTTTTPSVWFRYSDAWSSTANCSMYLNGSLKANNVSVINWTNSSLTSSVLSSLGSYSVVVNCTDNSGNIGSGSGLIINLTDATSPTINILNSSLNTSSTTPSISFNYTDSWSSTTSCVIYFNGTSKASNSSVLNNTLTVLTSSALTSLGRYEVYINCTDNSSNIGKSTTINITLQDTTPPIVNILNSSFGTISNYINISFNFTDTWSSTSNCSLYFNETIYANNDSTQNNTLTILNSTIITNGTYNTYINCTDTSSNIGKSNTITIQIINTITNINSPYQGYNWIYINWTNPPTIEYNHTEIWSNGTLLQNNSLNYYNDTGLTAATSYTYQLIPYNTAGEPGTNSTYTTSTTISPPLYDATLNITVNNSLGERVYNFTITITDTTTGVSTNYNSITNNHYLIGQENSNNTNYNSGWTNVAYAFDGNWETYAAVNTLNTRYIIENYTKPTNSTINSVLNYKIGEFLSATSHSMIFTEHPSCFNNQDQIIIYIETAHQHNTIYCYNGIDYELIRNISTSANTKTVYETNITWDMMEIISNASNIPIINGRNYTMMMDAETYSYAYANNIFTNLTNVYNFELGTTNTLYINDYDETTGLIIPDNISIKVQGTITSYTTTTTGNTSIEMMIPDTYNIVFNTSTNYSARTYTVTMLDRNSRTLNAYLLKNTLTSDIGVYTRNTIGDPLPTNITIYQIINGTYISVLSTTTDELGYGLLILAEGGYYRFVLNSEGYNTKSFYLTVYYVNSPYTFKLSTNTTSGGFTPSGSHASYIISPTNSSLTEDNYTFSITTNSPTGSLIWTAITCNGISNNISGSPNGATANLLINTTGTNILYCNYSFQITGYDYPNIIPWSYSIMSGYNIVQNKTLIKMMDRLKNEITDNAQTKPWLIVLATFLILTGTLTIYQLTGNGTISTVTSFAGLIVFAYLGWYPWYIALIPIIIGGLGLYLMNR